MGVSFEESDENEEESRLELCAGDEGMEGEVDGGLFVRLLWERCDRKTGGETGTLRSLQDWRGASVKQVRLEMNVCAFFL